MPLSMLFGPEALEYRLVDSAAKVAIADESSIASVLAVALACRALTQVIAVGDAARRGGLDWRTAMRTAYPRIVPATTLADDPAVLIYTSGTTGPPKGALIPQRALIGNLTGFVCSQNWFPLASGTFWSPADWAWTGGLMDALLPTLYFGRPILGFNGRFAPERAAELMLRHGVTHTFLFPTALKAMMKALPDGVPGLRLRAIMSAGEAVGDAVFAYCRDALGVTVNEMFGQTEINYIVGNCGRYVDVQGHEHAGWPARAGSMGRGYPGHRVAVIDDAGRELPPGEAGDVAVHRRDVHGDLDPIFFLGYWKRDDATRAKFTGDPLDSWCRTGDMAVCDRDGYLWYQGRGDDMFKSAGYRIGPAEIENCLVKHEAVANAAVVPSPDEVRGHVIKAFILLAPGVAPSASLEEAIRAHVKSHLAPWQQPRFVEFVGEFPMTTTGKVQRRVLREREAARVAAQGIGAA
jgi:acetyl-CoA synthetase